MIDVATNFLHVVFGSCSVYVRPDPAKVDTNPIPTDVTKVRQIFCLASERAVLQRALQIVDSLGSGQSVRTGPGRTSPSSADQTTAAVRREGLDSY